MEPYDLNHAIRIAVRFHEGQTDKAGEPYILHPLRVMLALPPGTDEYVRIAAVLHDVVEDTDATIESVRSVFGEPSAHIVDAVTKRKGENYHDYVRRVTDAGRDAILVKLCDLRDNLGQHRPHRPSREYVTSRASAEAYLAACLEFAK